MKKFINTCILLLAVSLLSAQDVTTKFSGITADGHYCLLDSVRVENLTRGWSTVLDCTADTSFRVSVQTGPTTGIENIQTSSMGDGISLSNYVNHVMFHSFALNVSTSGPVSIDVWDVLGRKVLSVQEMLSEGTYQYQVHLDHPAAFFLSVRTSSGMASLKLLNMANAGRNDICSESFGGTPLLLPRRVSSQITSSEFTSAVGDQMRYTGYMCRQGQVETSDPEIFSQDDADTQITLHFASAQYSQEGIYVGLVGFNSQLYSYPFKLITSSNLSTFNSFVNGLNTANGTILYHAVYNALDSISRAPIPSKLSNVTLVTFTDGLDVGSFRLNPLFKNGQAYLDAVIEKSSRTYVNGTKLVASSIGILGSDVSDEARFYSDLHQLATDSSNVFTVSDMSDVSRKFRDIAANIFQTNVYHSLSLKIPAPDPGSRIRLTFDAVSDASQSAYYLEGDYNFEDCGVLNNVQYSGVRCSNGSTLVSVPDGLFDIFTINNLENNLGEQVSLANIQQWYYVPSTGQWQLNSEFTPEGNTTTTEDRSSALVMLVLDCSSSLGDNFSSMKDAAKEFLKILAGSSTTTYSKPTISSESHVLGNLQVICRASASSVLSIIDRGICISENANMDNSTYYSAGSGDGAFECTVENLVEGKTYYYHSYAKNSIGVRYGNLRSFVAKRISLPVVNTSSISDITYTGATISCSIVSDGNGDISSRGICYSVDTLPTCESGTKKTTSVSTNEFTVALSNLQPGVTYHVRAFAQNVMGIAYGEDMTFTTKAYSVPTVTTTNGSSITYKTFTSGGRIVDNGGQNVTSQGICYSPLPNPTIDNTKKTASRKSDGSFTCSLTGLEIGTIYYVRAYAINAAGVGYGEEIEISTKSFFPISVASNKKVQFAKGNLTSSLKIASTQYYTSETNTSDTSPVTLMGWGTGNNPTNTSAYPSRDYPYNEWGSKVKGDVDGLSWTTLSISQWTYIFQGRANASSLYGMGKIDGKFGLFILPDEWECPQGISFAAGSTNNNYTLAKWKLMEDAGAIFLPAAGHRIYKNQSWVIQEVGTCGYYWSSSAGADILSSSYGACLSFSASSGVSTDGAQSKCSGCAVRVVHIITEF